MGRILLSLLLPGLLLTASPSSAQLIQHLQSGIEEVARGMDYVGRRAGTLFSGTEGKNTANDTLPSVQREVEEHYPATPASTLFLANEFGDIRIRCWDERLIQIKAVIQVSAPTEDLAEQVSSLIELRVEQEGDYWECRTSLPELRSGDAVAMSVHYEAAIPKDATLTINNYFGDVYVNDLGGALTAEIQYGALHLSHIQGLVRARIQGEFPVRANYLNQGGTFIMTGTDAEFLNFQGNLDITQFRGSVTVRHPGPESTVNLISENGRTEILLPPDANPDLTATVAHGRFESELDVTRVVRGKQLLARHLNAEAKQRFMVNASFSDVLVGIEGGMSQTVSRMSADQKAFTDTTTTLIPFESGNTMVIDAMPSNIHIEGVDEDQLSVEMTRVAWTPSAAAAMDALDALEIKTVKTPGFIHLTTRATQDMTAFSCQSYRADLRIKCPRTLPVTLNAEKGATVLQGVGADCVVNQESGEVQFEHMRGMLTVSGNTTSVTAKSCIGPLIINVASGDITAKEIFDSISINNGEGRVLVDTPGKDTEVRQRKGDVHFLSLAPLAGKMDIFTEAGDINVFIAPESSASITVKTQGGQIRSALPLTGSINLESQEFFGRINTGEHTVLLETVQGSIYLN